MRLSFNGEAAETFRAQPPHIYKVFFSVDFRDFSKKIFAARRMFEIDILDFYKILRIEKIQAKMEQKRGLSLFPLQKRKDKKEGTDPENRVCPQRKPEDALFHRSDLGRVHLHL